MRKNKVVFFDAGGTLFRPWPSVGAIYARVAEKHGVRVDADQIENAFYATWHKRNDLVHLDGTQSTSEKIERDWWYTFVQDVFRQQPRHPQNGGVAAFDDFDAFFKELYDLFARAECWRLFDDTVPALETLKAAGIRMAILSNWDQRLFGIVEQLGLSPYFETVIASSTVGSAKPAPMIFQAALDAMKTRPGDSVHVGDSLVDDYEGASKMGLQALLIDRSTRAYNGVRRLYSLKEITTHLS